MKKIILIILLSCMLMLTGCSKVSKEQVVDKVYKKYNKAKGYQITGKMELINNECSYDYDITVSYKKGDMYRVSLRNNSNNHEQVILRNKDGVYVFTPSLNKSFKFESKWPFNNSQAYIPQTIINDLKEDPNLTMKETENGYLFKSKVNYKNNSNLKYQKVLVNKNHLIKEVTVYDSNDNAQIKVVFEEIDLKAKFDNSYFDLEENSEEIENETTNTISLDDPIYPMYIPEGTYLDDEKVVDLDKGSRIILTFAGDNSFMLGEEVSSISNDMEIIPTSGDLDLFADSVAVVSDNSVTWTSSGIDYYLVSDVLSSEELISIASSVSTMPVGK